jgi:hypothetical protein
MVYIDYFYIITIKVDGVGTTSFSGVKSYPATFTKYDIFKDVNTSMERYTQEKNFSYLFYNVERNVI